MLGLALVLALTQTPQHRLFRQPNLPRTSLARFEFAPLSGTGMGTACACAAVTGAKGEAMTFTRASSGTCLKGNTTAGIVNTDMVTCTNNQVRVMPGGDGTGGLGMLIEEARTNSTLRSQEIDNVVWVQNADAAPRNTTVTADQAVAPDNTTTADKLDLIATSGVQFSTRAQITGCPGGTNSAAVFLKGVSGSGTTDLTLNVTNAACTFTSTDWTRCKVENAAGGGGQLAIGNNSLSNGGVARSTQSVYVWGVQCEAGAFASSYIATAGATAARSAEVASFSLTTTGSTASIALTWVTPTVITNTPIPFSHLPAGTQFYGNWLANKWRAVYFNGASTVTKSSTASMVAGVANRVASQLDGVPNLYDCLAGFCESAAGLTYTPGAASLYIGCFNSSSDWANGVLKQVCYDPSPTRCQ